MSILHDEAPAGQTTITVKPQWVPSTDADTRDCLGKIVVRINAAKTSVAESIIEIGAALAEAQEQLVTAGCKSEFTPWLRHYCGFSRSTAYNYIDAFNAFGKCPTVGRFAPAAMYLLANPAHEAARKSAINASKRGQQITKQAAQRIIRKAERRAARVATPKLAPHEVLANFQQAVRDSKPVIGICHTGQPHELDEDRGVCANCSELMENFHLDYGSDDPGVTVEDAEEQAVQPGVVKLVVEPKPLTLKDALRKQRAKDEAIEREPVCGAIARTPTSENAEADQVVLITLVESLKSIAAKVATITANRSKIEAAVEAEHWTSATKTRVRGILAGISAEFRAVDKMLEKA